MPIDPQIKTDLVSAWVPAPAASHLKAFRLASRLKGRKREVVIEVLFEGGKIYYRYYPDRETEDGMFTSDTIFSSLCLAEQPGKVVNTALKDRKVFFSTHALTTGEFN